MFLIIRVTVRSCTSAGQRSLRLPLLCGGEDGFSTKAADGRHSGAVSPVYTKISKILVIVHNVRGIWTIWCCWWWWRRALWKYGKEFTLSYNCIAAPEPLSTILPIWRTNSSLWSNFFLSGKKALFALWFVDICWSNHRNIRLMLCKSRSCSNQTEVWELDHFFGSGVYTTILSVREGSVFELWFVDIGWSTRISDWCALQKPQIWSNQTEVWGLNHFFIRGFHQSGAQWHFDQQLHMVPVQSDFWIKEMNTWCTFTNSMSFGTSVLRSCRRSDKLSSLN